MLSFLMSKHPGVERLGYTRDVFLTFSEASILFPEYLPEVKDLCIENDKILTK